MRTRAPLLVGREPEIGELERALAAARTGRGRSIFVVGEAGIGKSRLAAEATGRAFTEGMAVLRGRSSTLGPLVPFRPLAEALLSLFRRGELPDDSELGPYRRVLGRLVPDWGTGADQPGGAAPAAVRSGGESLVVLAEAVLRLIAAAGRDRGCLLVLEDLHDVDVETLAVVEYLADNLDQQPSLLLATIRTEPCAALDLAGAAARRHAATVLELDRLDYSAVCEIGGCCLGVAAAEVPVWAAEQLWENSAGNPFMVEELLHGMISSGQLVRGAEGWREVREVRTEVPDSLVRSVALRVDRLGPQGRSVLSAAAVLGRRFPLSVVQKITGLGDHDLLSQLHGSVVAQLVAPDERGPDWYAFQHPLLAEALLAQLTPAERVAFSGRAADAVQAIHPDLPDEWCQLAATLRAAAGDAAAAARLFTQAGRRALADGAAGSAIALLEQAERLLAGHGDAAGRAEVLEMLLYGLAESGQLERAFRLAETLDAYDTGLDVGQRVALRVRLAWAAHIAGRWDDGAAQVGEARAVLGPDAREEHTAPIDAVAAYLTLDTPGPDRLVEAEALARRAVSAAERIPLPVIACQAWNAIGVIARQRDLHEASACFARTWMIAEEHRLPIWRMYGLGGQATNAWLADGDTGALLRARTEALGVGAIIVAQSMDAVLALNAVLRGEYEAAAGHVAGCLATTRRLQLASLERYLLMVQATLDAHRGDRPAMEETLAEFRRRGGTQCRELPLSFGLARAFCALLEENAALARRELARVLASQQEKPTTFYLAGEHGLHLLLGVLDRDAGWDRFHRINAAAVSRMRWNRQFVHLAHAVLLGRDGRAEQAATVATAAFEAAGPYPMARHLGMRLVAEAARADRWGDPTGWLRAAEEHFHQAGVPAVAGACRALLRQGGAHVPQRRTGTGRIPRALRELGVTLREYEVLELVVQRLGNKAIGGRLHLSPRTVEKHVASLLAKTGGSDRSALIERAAELLQ